MRRLATLLGLSAGVLIASASWAAEVAPSPVTVRPVVDGVATAIADNYFDPAKGAAVAGQLRAEAAKGTYDRLTDPRDLATALTERLRPLDHHFVVSWSSDAAARDPAVGAVPPRRPGPPPGQAGPERPGPGKSGPQEPDPFRRANYGVRKVEILGGNLGYVDLRMFGDFEFGQPDAPARKAIEAALQTVSNTDAVIIDLRDNGGGSPAMVGYLSSAFTPKGADIYNTFRFRDRTESEAPLDWYPAPRVDVPLYLLISPRTGSAAEAFAYTLKNARRAVIVGEASAGAANPGGPVRVGGGFAVFVSNGSPVSPITKTNWEGDGVKPDVEVASAQALTTARALALEAVLKTASGPDAQDARWALEALRAEASPPATKPLTDYVGTFGAVDIVQADGHIGMKRGRRPVVVLLPLGGDAFTVLGESARRVVFERDATGAVTAFEARSSDGASARYRREPAS